MRVTGGRLRGRRLEAPPAGVRPTQDRVREALFSMLGAALDGARFLDLFAGSGAVGIDAWSRGARSVCWIESNRRVLAVLQRNVAALCDTGAGRVIGLDAWNALARGMAGGPFDVVFADPPYAEGPEGGQALAVRLLGELRRAPRGLGPRGIVFIEQAGRFEAGACPAGWVLLRDRAYGRTRLLAFQRVSEESEIGAGQ